VTQLRLHTFLSPADRRAIIAFSAIRDRCSHPVPRQPICRRRSTMTVKVLIKRRVPADKAKDMIPLFRRMRTLANEQNGYISGETLRNLEKPEEFLVISVWDSSQDWNNWLNSPQRKEIQMQVDRLLGGETQYEIFHHGFTE
jgi:heme-degrading monooxygenase HmoA